MNFPTKNTQFIDEIEKKRIRWHSRRGLLELDLVLERFLAHTYEQLNQAELQAYREILVFEDNDFLDLVNEKAQLQLQDQHLSAILEKIRRA